MELKLSRMLRLGAFFTPESTSTCPATSDVRVFLVEVMARVEEIVRLEVLVTPRVEVTARMLTVAAICRVDLAMPAMPVI